VIDVVAVAYGSAEAIGRCIDATTTIPERGRVVVVDHGDDGSADIAAGRGAEVVRDPTNPGFGAGQNRGVGATSAEYVLLLNPDALVDGAAVGRGAALLRAQTDVAMVQGVIVGSTSGEAERSRGDELGPLHLWGRALRLRRLLRVGIVRAVARRVPALADHVDREPAEVEDVEWLAATVVLVRRAAFDAVGGFDASRYFLYGEDLDLCRRLRAAGWRLVAVPERWATHVSGGSSASSWLRETEWWRGTMAFAARWWRGGPFAAAVLAAVARWVPLAVRSPSRAGAAWRALVGDAVRARRSRASAPARPSPG